MGNIDFYCWAGSPPCGAVQVVASLVGVNLNSINIDVIQGEQMSPEFLSMNPIHTVPVLKDGDLILTESRAILQYLIEKYQKGSNYYPEDVIQKALINQRLFFDVGVLYPRMAAYYYPFLIFGQPEDPDKRPKMEEAIKCLELFLEKSEFLAGANPTLADVSIAFTISTYELFSFDLSPYSRILTWYERCKTDIPGFREINDLGQKNFKAAIEKMNHKS